jgi:FixJ family two-component response regulator
VSDVIMPNMRGTELAACLRMSRPDLLVLFISGFAPASEGEPAHEGSELLSKPFSPQQLVEAVERALASAQKNR